MRSLAPSLEVRPVLFLLTLVVALLAGCTPQPPPPPPGGAITEDGRLTSKWEQNDQGEARAIGATGGGVVGPLWELVQRLEPAGESHVRSTFALSASGALAGTEETADVFKTTDAGRTWRKTFDGGDAFRVQDIRTFIRAQDGTLYASTSGQGDILASTDEGETWRLIQSLPAWRTVGMAQLQDGTLLVGTRKDESGETSLYRSRDGFATVERIALATPQQQNVTTIYPLGESRALAGVGFDGTAKVFLTTDSGRTWRQVADFTGTADIMDFIAVDDALYAATKSTATIYRSTDGGETWTPHAQIWERGFLGTFDRLAHGDREYLLLAGSDQRERERIRHVVLISADQGATWHEWAELQLDVTGAASNLTVLGNHTVLVGTGNHSAQGRLFVLAVDD